MSGVLLVTDIFPPEIGGPATFIDRLAHELAAGGRRVTVVCSSDGPPDASDAARRFRVLRVDRTNRYRYEVRLRLVLSRELLRTRHVLVNGLEPYVGQVAAALRRRYVLKVVGDVVWETGRNAGSVLSSVDEFQGEAVIDRRLRGLQVGRQRYLALADTVITPSDYLRDLVVGWGVPAERVQTVPNGVGFEDLSGAPPRSRTSGPLDVMFCGRLTNWKGVDTAILAVERLDGVRLTVAGSGPELPALVTLAAQLGLGDRVRFLGRLTQDMLHRALVESHVLVLPSAYEGMSHTLLEAGALGLARVASDAGGNPEVITSEDDGLLVPYGDVAALGQALARLRDDERLRQRLARRGQERSRSFSFAETARRTIDLLGLSP